MTQTESRGSRIFFKFLITYIILVFVVAWPFYPMSRMTFSTIKESMIKDSYNALQTGFMDIDNQIVKFYQAANTLGEESNFAELVRVSGFMETKDYYKLINLNRYLMIMNAQSSGIVIDAGVAFAKNDIIITKSKIFTIPNIFYPGRIQVEGMDFYEWKEYLFSSQDAISFRPEQPVEYDRAAATASEVKQTIHYVVPLPATAITKNSVLFFLFDADRILEHLTMSEDILKDGFIYMVNKNNEFILRHNYEGDVIEIQNGDIQEMKYNGTNTTMLTISSNNTGLKVVVGIPDNMIIQKMSPVVRFYNMYLLSALVLGVLISLFFAHRQSFPIQNIVNIIRNSTGDTEKKNVYEFIEDVFVKMNQTNEVYKQQLEEMDHAIKIGLLQKILSEGYGDEQEKTDFVTYYQLEDTYFCVILVEVIPGESNQEQLGDIRRVNLAAADSIERNLAFRTVIYNSGSGKMAVILNLASDESSLTSAIKVQCKFIYEEICQLTGFRVFFRISEIGSGIESIHHCCFQAKNIFISGEHSDEAHVYVYTKQPGAHVLLDIATAKKLYDLIVMGELERVRQIFLRLRKHSEKYWLAREQDVRQTFYSVRNILENAAQSLLKEGEDMLLPTIHDNDMQDLSVKEVLALFEEVAEKLCHYVDSSKRKKNVQLKESMIKYLEHNHSNPNLCAAMAAEHYKLSEQYIFRLIKEYTGKSFGEYVEEMRLRQAEMLLRDTDIQIKQIHKQIGFNSHNTFYKAFYRKYEVPPGVWRSHHRSGS